MISRYRFLIFCALKRFINWRGVWALLTGSASEWNNHNAPRLGAALAFYTLFSVAPFLVVVTTIGSLFFGSGEARDEMARQIFAVAGPAGGKVAASILGGTHDAGHGILATVSSVVILFFGASGVLIELRDALNVMWDIPAPPRTPVEDLVNLVRERLFAFIIVLSIGFFLLASLTVDAMAAALVHRSLPGASLVSFVVITGFFAAIFKFIPDFPLRWIDVLPGALVTSLLFTIGRVLIAVYLARADFGTWYGSAASTTALLVWLYYSSQIFFFGAAFTKVLARRSGTSHE